MFSRLAKIFKFSLRHTMFLSLLFATVSLGMFIYEISSPEVFIEEGKTKGYLVIFVVTLTYASFISFYDFINALLERRQYKDKDWHIAQKALKLMSKYMYLLFTVLMLTTLNEIISDFNDKSHEMRHYVREYSLFLEDESYEVQTFVSLKYLANKQNYFWMEDTMYVDGGFTDELIVVNEQLKNKEPLEFDHFIELDTDNFLLTVNEDMYYIVQTLTTLGYGDILPNYPVGKLIAWISVLGAQFITIIGVIIVVRDK